MIEAAPAEKPQEDLQVSTDHYRTGRLVEKPPEELAAGLAHAAVRKTLERGGAGWAQNIS